MLLYFIRHAEPIYEPDSLTEKGHIQAKLLANVLSKKGINKIYSSTSNRAILTAKPTADLLEKEINLVDFANEKYPWDSLTDDDENGRFWIYQSTKYKEIFHLDDVINLKDRWYEHPLLSKPKFKEEFDRISDVISSFFKPLGYTYLGHGKFKIERVNNDTIALFAHQGFGLAFLSVLLGIPYPNFCTHFDLTHSSYTVIEFNDDNGFSYPRIISLSNDSHLNF